MFEFDLADVEVNGLTIKVNGIVYKVPDIVMLVQEVQSLREENVKLNKDRSALHDINEGLQKQVHNYQDTIANNLTGIRCKELESEVEQLKQQVSALEEVLLDGVDEQSKAIHNLEAGIDQLEECYKELLDVLAEYEHSNKALHRELDIRSDKIWNLQTELKVLKDYCNDLSDCNKVGLAKHKDQQAVIEFQKNDIERLVKLNSKLINEREELKPKQNLLGDYLKVFTATSVVKDNCGGKYCTQVSGVIGETLVSVTFADNTGLSDTCLKFVESLINNKTAQ